jgi:hypothetical protein
MGPYGSAKTTSCFQKILNSVAMWQNPNPHDGVRRVKVVRDPRDLCAAPNQRDGGLVQLVSQDEGQLERRADGPTR